jgi:hypothetical protein
MPTYIHLANFVVDKAILEKSIKAAVLNFASIGALKVKTITKKTMSYSLLPE